MPRIRSAYFSALFVVAQDMSELSLDIMQSRFRTHVTFNVKVAI